MSRYLYKKIQNISPESLNFQHSGLKLTTLGSDPGVPYIKYVSKIEFFNASTFQCKLELTLVILSVYPSY